MKNSISRRNFTKSTIQGVGAAILAPVVLPSSVFGKTGRTTPGDRIVMGIIGCGNRGTQVLKSFLEEKDTQFVAVCDVQEERKLKAVSLVNEKYRNKDCKPFHDFRNLLARPDIDAVLIATGDRWHGIASVMAARAGKDIYCEKPISLTIAESRVLADTVRRYNIVYQAGTQRRSVGNFIFAIELARTGKLGKLVKCHVEIKKMGLKTDWLPAEPDPPASMVDWDMWLGQAPWRPFNKKYLKGMGVWQDYFDFGGGGITDWGCHTLDLAQLANNCELSSPVEYMPFPDRVEAVYANGVEVSMYRGIGRSSCGIRFEGTEGRVETDDSGHISTYPRSLRREKMIHTEDWHTPATHIRNFLDCVRSRCLCAAHAEAAHYTITACHIANISVMLGRKLKWNPAKEEFINDEAANRMRSRAMRGPWQI